MYMRIAIIGPSHPYKGGIVQHTTELAHRLSAAGHDVELIAWKSQFPSKLYPGELLPANQPEQPLFTSTKRLLSWNNPLSWRRAGKYLHLFDLVIFVWWVPTLQGPIYSEIARHLKGVRKAAICHNVLPHESRPGDAMLTRHFFSRLDYLIVHTPEQADVAKRLTKRDIFVPLLPPLLPGWTAENSQHNNIIHKQLLFFGLVRDYKGLDVLLNALALVP
jgi:glycosyltransferase involved in cell wall biosynthesis